MMKKVKSFLSSFIVLTMLLQTNVFAYTSTFDKLDDGTPKSEEEEIIKEFVLINGDDKEGADMLTLPVSEEIKAQGRTSTVLWENHKQRKNVEFSRFPANPLDYSYMYFHFYVPENYNNELLIYLQSRSGGYGIYRFAIESSGWVEMNIPISAFNLNNESVDLSSVNRVYILAEGGWSMVADPRAKIYIQDLKFVDDGTRYTREEVISQSWDKLYAARSFSDEINALAKEIAENSVIVHRYMPTVLSRGEKGLLAANNMIARAECIGMVDMVPVSFFESYLGAQTASSGSSASVTLDGKTLSVSEGINTYVGGTFSQTPCRIYDEMYVPLTDVLNYFSVNYKLLGKAYIISDAQTLEKVVQEHELSECIATKFTDNDFEITEEDYNKVKENVRRMYLGENNDMSNPRIKEWVSDVEKEGEKWLTSMTWDMESSDLWAGIGGGNQGGRSVAYAQRIAAMAYAWGTEGSKYYKDPDMLEATIFATEYWARNIYTATNPDFISQQGGWHNWQYQTPNYILPALFIISDEVSPETMSRWLSGVDYDNPSSVGGRASDREVIALDKHVNWAGNKCWQLRIALWSAILQKQPERIRQEVNIELRKTFQYIEHLRNGVFHKSANTSFNAMDNRNCGVYADGSYIDHQYYPCIATYGANYFGVMSTVFRSIKGTSIFPTDPIVHNQVDFVRNCVEPLVWKNVIYWRARNRDVRSEQEIRKGHISKFVGYYIDMLDYVTGDDAAYLKSAIKTQGQYIENTDLIDTTGPNMILYDSIMNDASVKVLENKDYNKVFFNMGVVAHNRDDWRFYLAMNSTEVGLAEIYNYSKENFYGFHQSDGSTTLLTNDPEEYDGNYWRHVDPTKIAGVTSIEKPFDFITGSICYGGTYFVGGTTLDNRYGVAAMDFYGHNRDAVTRDDNKTDAYYSDLAAHKSWFMFDDEVVCLGSGISNTEDYEAITTIENKRLEGEMPYKDDSYVEQYVPVKVTAIGHDGNVPGNTIDYNLATRWSYEGADGWILYDLGEVKELGYTGIAFYSGNTRKTRFKLLTSVDGSNWTTHYNGESDGLTDEMLAFNTPGQARYIKIECAGNNFSAWNSISEVQFYPAQADGSTPMNGRPPFIYGLTDVWADGELLPKTDFEANKIENVDYVSIDKVGGYYFPGGADITFDKYSENGLGFIDFYVSHGITPTDGKYAYAILPTMTKEETAAYAQNPRFTILKNEASLQSVRHNDLGITGTVFWEAGETDTLTTDIPCTVNMYEDENVVKIAIADPSKRNDRANLKLKMKNLSLVSATNCVTVTRANDGYVDIALDFTKSYDPAFKGESFRGGTYTIEFTKNAASDDTSMPQTPQESISSGGSSGGSGAGGKDTSDKTESTATLFNDIRDFVWAEDAIASLTQKGVIAKSSDGKFRPADAVTREEFVKMLVVALDVPKSAQDYTFKDGVRGAWYESYLAAAKESGIVQGREDGSFGVGETISRQDMAVMLRRAISAMGYSLDEAGAAEKFTDEKDIAPYALDAVSLMQKSGLIQGMGDGSFAPKSSLNRAQAAVIIKRIMDITVKEAGAGDSK